MRTIGKYDGYFGGPGNPPSPAHLSRDADAASMFAQPRALTLGPLNALAGRFGLDCTLVNAKA